MCDWLTLELRLPLRLAASEVHVSSISSNLTLTLIFTIPLSSWRCLFSPAQLNFQEADEPLFRTECLHFPQHPQFPRLAAVGPRGAFIYFLLRNTDITVVC